jgi:hypothetical protein
MLHEFEAVRAVHIPHEILFVVIAEAIEHAPVLPFGFGFPLSMLHILKIEVLFCTSWDIVDATRRTVCVLFMKAVRGISAYQSHRPN